MDLIESLRRHAQSMARGINAPAVGSDPSHYLVGQAADEIKRLRVAIRQAHLILLNSKFTSDERVLIATSLLSASMTAPQPAQSGEPS